MAKAFSHTKSGPEQPLSGVASLIQMMGQEKRRALSITWPGVPENPQAIRLRILPQPRLFGRHHQPGAFCDFEINNL